jgi:hypothetical protein
MSILGTIVAFFAIGLIVLAGIQVLIAILDFCFEHTVALVVLMAGIPLAFLVSGFVGIAIAAPVQIGICVIASVVLASLPRLCLAIFGRHPPARSDGVGTPVQREQCERG